MSFSSGTRRTHAPPEKYLKTLLRQAVRFTLVVEFLVNLYVFPFLVELVFVPFVSLFVVTQVVVASKPEYAPARKFTEVVLALVGIALLSNALTSGLSDVDGFLTRENAENFLVAPALTLAFLPYCLAVAWVSRREQENLRKQFRAQYGSPGIGGPGAIRPGGGSRRAHKTIAPG